MTTIGYIFDALFSCLLAGLLTFALIKGCLWIGHKYDQRWPGNLRD